MLDFFKSNKMRSLFLSLLFVSVCLNSFSQTFKGDSLFVLGDSLFSSFSIQYFRNGYLFTEKQFRDDALIRFTTWKATDTLENTCYYNNGVVASKEIFVIKSEKEKVFTGLDENLYYYYLFQRIEYNDQGVITSSENYDYFFSKTEKKTVSLPIISIIYDNKGKPLFQYEWIYDEDLHSSKFRTEL